MYACVVWVRERSTKLCGLVAHNRQAGDMQAWLEHHLQTAAYLLLTSLRGLLPAAAASSAPILQGAPHLSTAARRSADGACAPATSAEAASHLATELSPTPGAGVLPSAVAGLKALPSLQTFPTGDPQSLSLQLGQLLSLVKLLPPQLQASFSESSAPSSSSGSASGGMFHLPAPRCHCRFVQPIHNNNTSWRQ